MDQVSVRYLRLFMCKWGIVNVTLQQQVFDVSVYEMSVLPPLIKRNNGL